jgi:hypothetical protein
MRVFLLLLLIHGALPFSAFAQQFRGQVYDAATSAPIGTVLVTNTRSGAMWVSDSAGNIAFTAYPGDVITFQHPAYKLDRITIVGYNDVVAVGLTKAPIQLAEVEVLSPMLQFKRDSAFNHQFFHKELGYVHSQIGIDNISGAPGTGVGVGVGGVFSELALLISGKKKQYRRLEKEMLFLEQMRYSDIRYTPSLVAAQTGLNDSAANAFIVRHPIPDDFVRAASELELKMWVREQWRAELKADTPAKGIITERR